MAKKAKKAKEVKQPEEVDVKQAVRAAITFLDSLFGDEGIKDIRLEEVEFVDMQNEWLITLGFLRRIPREEIPRQQRAIQEYLGSDYSREYKAVAIDARTGHAKSIKMRSAV